jgi:hypothetical protein
LYGEYANFGGTKTQSQMVYCQERFFWFLVRPMVQQNLGNVFSGYKQIPVYLYAGAVLLVAEAPL